jgi:enamine deaminase RidA (YjgF/YER057c/UK114 family)
MASSQQTEKGSTMPSTTDARGKVEYLNPDTLNKNPAFTNVVVVSGPTRTVYVGGQDSIDASGTIIGKGDFKAQAEQTLKNVQDALAAGGAQLDHVVKWNLYIVQGQPLQEGFEVFQSFWGDRPNRPAISMAFVAGLAHPDFLIEIDAIAVVPE